MKIIEASVSLEGVINSEEILKRIERAGRVSYKSEDKITKDSASKFVKKMMNFKHVSVIEHSNVSFRIVCDRGVSHEIVRHRLFSYTQESTRYVNYSKGKFGKEITVIKPCFLNVSTEVGLEKYKIWELAMRSAEKCYMGLLNTGAKPQEARSVLPNSLKTEIVMSGNLRNWMHFLDLRCNKVAHPQMREIALPILDILNKELPEIFGTLYSEYYKEEV